MNGIFILTNTAGLKPLNDKQPAALLHLADGPVLAHLLRQAGKMMSAGLLLVPPADLPAVTAWLASQTAPPLVEVLPFDPTVDSLGDIWRAGRLAAAEPLFVTTDQAITIPDWEQTAAAKGDLMAFGPAACWLRRGDLLDSFSAPGKNGGYDDLGLPSSAAVPLKPPVYLPLTNPAEFLRANRRLLGIGYSSPDALERSYTEEFAIIPPVFIDPTAEIVASVIGPYAAVGAGAVVEDSIVRRTVIEPGANVSDSLLQDSHVGRGAVVTGHPVKLFATPSRLYDIQSQPVQKVDAGQQAE